MRTTIPVCGQYGVIKDQPSQEIPINAWSDAQNMRFRDGKATRFTGQSLVFTAPSVTPYYIAPYRTATKRYWLHSGIARVFVDDGTTRTEITRYAEGATISTITNVGTTATLTTATNHGRSNGDTVIVFNATPAAYNGTYVITVTGLTTWTYTMASDPGASATLDATSGYSTNATSNFTGAVDDRATGGNLNGVFIWNNGVDIPQYWAGDTTLKMRRLPGWDATWKAAALVTWKGFILALDVTKGSTRYPYMVKWCQPVDAGAVPSDWDATSVTNDAGEWPLAESDDILVGALPMGDALIIYKERSRYLVRQTFGQYIFSFQKLPGEGGMLARGCAIESPVGHIVLGNGDVYAHNGADPVSLTNGTVRTFIKNSIDTTYPGRSFVVANHQQNEAWICFPSSTATVCTKAAVYNWVDKTWAFRQLDNATYGASGLLTFTQDDTIDSQSSVIIDTSSRVIDADAYAPSDPHLLLTNTTPRIDIVDSGWTAAGASYTSYLERRNMVLDGDTKTVKLVTDVVPRFNAPAGAVIRFYLGGTNDVEVEPTWSAAFDYTVGTTGRVELLDGDSGVSGIFTSIRMESTDDMAWEIKSMDINYEVAGEY